MFDEHQIPNSGGFGIFIILSVITLISGLTTFSFFVDEDEDEDATDAQPLCMRLSQAC
jgi:hypothetical protein